jgi:hypothetical protein
MRCEMEQKQQPQQPQNRDKAQMGDKPGQIDERNKVGQDTDNDGRVVQPGHKPGEIDGDRQKGKL